MTIAPSTKNLQVGFIENYLSNISVDTGNLKSTTRERNDISVRELMDKFKIYRKKFDRDILRK